jgi:hypothetical protein
MPEGEGMPKLKKSLVILLTVALFMAAAAGCGREIVREQFLETYQVRSGTVISIYNRNGSVTVSGWDQDRVEIAAVKETYRGQSALDQVDIFIEIGEVLVIRTEHPDGEAEVAVSFDIKVPADLLIGTIECSNGSINIDSLTGNPELTTSNGNISANAINGIVTARSSNGNISALDVRSLGDLVTSNGSIEAELPALHDHLQIRTSNGTVSLSLNASLMADIEAETSNGSIEISNLNIDAEELERTLLLGSMNGAGTGYLFPLRTVPLS